VKIAEPAWPVLASWLREQGSRLDPGPFVSGAMEAGKLIEALPVWEPLRALTRGPEGGIFNGPMFRRIYLTDPDHGVPFVGSRAMMMADLTSLPLLRRSDALSSRLVDLRLTAGTTLVSCSGMQLGRVAYVRRAMAGMWSSQDVMKVVPDPERVPPGYLYAFLKGSFGTLLVKGGKYGTSVRHIEPEHIADLPVPRLARDLEERAHVLITEAAELRTRFQERIEAATSDLLESAGLADLLTLRWHEEPRDLGFEIEHLQPRSMRALNYAPRFRDIVRRLGEVPHSPLGDLCVGGRFGPGIRFRRIDAQPEHGVRLIGQRQGFWLRPEGRWISPRWAPPGVHAEDETVMIAEHGTLGENEVFCKAILVTGTWLDHVYTQDFRVY
jgi:type I restriction enzyme S subunit